MTLENRQQRQQLTLNSTSKKSSNHGRSISKGTIEAKRIVQNSEEKHFGRRFKPIGAFQLGGTVNMDQMFFEDSKNSGYQMESDSDFFMSTGGPKMKTAF